MKAKANNPKQQHFIPRTYLKPWSYLTKTKERKCFVHSKDGKLCQPRDVKSIMKEGDIYTILTRKDESRYEWENWLGKLETAYADARDRLEEAGYITTSDDHNTLAHFLSAQIHRTPTIRNHITKSLHIIEEIRKNPENDKPFCFNPENPKRYTSQDLAMVYSNPMIYMLLPEIEFLYSMVSRMNISIVRVTSAMEFCTSDNPVLIRNNFDPRAFVRQEGIANPAIEIMMPVTPKLCLLFTWDKRPDIDADLQAEKIITFNRMIASNAERWIVSRYSNLGFLGI